MNQPPVKPSLLGRLPLKPHTAAGVLSAALMLSFSEFVRSGFYSGYLSQTIDTRYGLPVALAGLAWTTHLTTDTLMRGPAGILLQRYGPRRVIMGGAALCLLAFSLLLVAKSSWMILLLAVLHGIGFSPMWPATMNLTADAAREGYQGRTLSFVSTAIMPATGLGLAVFAALIKKPDIEVTMLVMAMLGISLLLATLLPAHRVLPLDTEPKPRGHLTRALVPLIPAALMQTLTQSLVGNWLFRVASSLGLGYWDLIALLGFGGVLAFASMPFAGKVADRGRARFAVALGYALVAVAFAGFAFTPAVWVLFPLAAAAGLGYAFLTPGWAALITQTLPEAQRPAAWGVLMTVESAGFAAGPVLGGLALTHGGPASLFGLGAVLAALTSVGYVVFRHAFDPVPASPAGVPEPHNSGGP